MSATVTESWVGIDPNLDLELLVRRYSNGDRTVATRQAYSADSWGPEIALLSEGHTEDHAGRCDCGSEGCSDRAYWQARTVPMQGFASNSDARKRAEEGV